MNPQQARARVADTFSQAFHRARFLEFARNLLHRFDESKAAQWNTAYIKDAFKPHVARFERLGTYTSPTNEKLDVLIVHLANETKLERARTAIRSFVADHLKTRAEKDAALVAFVSPTERQWRFSYVKMEYAAVETESGKVGVETRLTPARRFSYIVGEGESCHTAQSRFLALLQDTEHPPTLTRIEEAFSVEAITKEFFKQYAALFGDIEAALQKLAARDQAISDELTKKHVSTVDFAKKLMGQIVFLYFLQKKGWLGVEPGQDWGAGPHDFLRRLAKGEYGAYDNFFNDILEPLFYDTLATDRGHEAWCQNFKCRIPFLNGGLFEPLGDYDWRQTDIRLPNRCFTNTERDPKTGDTGTGILDVFERYNFTVNEAEPLEKEVAIDPEMLGKVFENLIEENRRKGLGSFYTPREIVHYMCQESLINYLDTSVNTPEPTVPHADLETFVHLGDQISHYEAVDTRYVGREMPRTIRENARLLDEKLADITVCDPAVGSGAFPVGMMTEMVRARSALTPYFNDVHDRTPYHFKRHAIQNCLYGVDIDPGAVEIAKLRLWLSLVVDEEDVKQIKPLPNLFYKIVTGNSLLGVEKNLFNQELFRRLEALKPRYFDEPDKDKKDRYKQQIEDIIHELTSGKEAFDFEIYFSEVFHRKNGFDVLIANPPYGAKFSSQEKQTFLRVFRHQDYQLDSYLLFLERAFDLLRKAGVLAFIIPNPWLTNLTLKKIRRFVFGQHTVHEIAHYARQVFDAIVDTEVVILRNGATPQNSVLIRIVGENNQSVCKSVEQSKWAALDGEPINIFVSPAEERVIAKINEQSERLSALCAVTVGMKPYQVGKGVPKQTREIVENRVFDSTHRKDKSYRPLLRGRDIEKYLIKWKGDRWIKYGDHLAEPRPSAGFDAPAKIVIRQTGDSLIAALDDSQFVCMNNMHTILPKDGRRDLRFILGLLNSRLLNYYFQWLNPEKGEALAEVKKEHVEKLVIIKNAEENQRKAVVERVDRILAAKAQDPAADVSGLEREIDQLVYALYGLTPEEIQIVEAAAK